VPSEATAGDPQHRSGGAAFWFRLTDNLFRRLGWWLLPIVAFTALGVVQAGKTIDLYHSSATLSAIENPLVDAPIVGGASVQWWETPAAATSRIINEQLRTDSFISAVADSAGLADAIEADLVTREIVRSSVWSSPAGDGILSVNATWADPQTSFQLVTATIDEYQNYITESVASDAAEAEEFYTEQLTTATEERDAAERELSWYLNQFADDKPADEQPLSVQLEIERLSDRLSAAESKVAAAQAGIETAQLQVAQQTTRAGRTFSVVDQPSLPTAPMSTLMDRITTVGSYFVLGLVVAGAALLVTTVLNRSVMSAADLLAFDAVSLVATVPPIELARGRSKRTRLSGRRRGVATA
jgi:hypothetical protein